MGRVRNESGILKLVRPGGIVELYLHPIKAAQVMERYPRHCVTRPDVFKFPYIVVKPDSILNPGRVFFIVPYHTIYRLLQSKGYQRHRSHNTLEQIDEIDTSFFHQIIPVDSSENKKQIPKGLPRARHVSDLSIEDKDGDYESDEAGSSCFPVRKKGGGKGSMCLKPCLKKKETRGTRSQQGPRVRFTLPEKDDDDDYENDDEDVDLSDF